VIGRTVLRTYEEEAGREYPVTRKYRPNLFGIQLLVKASLAYQQQDTVVAACATVALWSAFHKTQRLFDSLRPSPAQVTRCANAVRGSGRAMPSHSLTPEQMGEAILTAGLEPEYVEIKPDTPLSSLIYGYAKMGIPVVLLVYLMDDKPAFHAITVVGYGFSQTVSWAVEPERTIRYYGRRIDRLFVHDDNVGPFAYVRIMSTPPELMDEKANPEAAEHFSEAPYTLEVVWHSAEGVQRLACAPLFAVIPVDQLIRLTFLGLHRWLNYFAEIIEAYKTELKVTPASIVWNTRLQRANDLKMELRRIASSQAAVPRILVKPYPLYVWRTTLTIGTREVLEIFADATEVDTAFPLLDILYYDDPFGRSVTEIFGLSEVRDRWAIEVGRLLVDFLATN
jgi:hypothetical protein